MPSDGKDFLGPLTAPRSLRSYTPSLKDLPAVARAQTLQKGNSSGEITASTKYSERPEEIKKAATDFEALLLQQMFEAMWQAVPSDGLISGSREEELYRDMFNQGLAQEIAAGQGIGIRAVIERELKGGGK